MKFNKLIIVIFVLIIIFPISIFSKDVKFKSKKNQVFQKKIKKCNKIYNQGKELFLKQDYKKAEKKFNKALEVLNDHAASNFLLSQIYYKQKNYDVAEKYIINAKKCYNSRSNSNINNMKMIIIQSKGIIVKLHNHIKQLKVTCTGRVIGLQEVEDRIKEKENLIKIFENRIQNTSQKSSFIPSEYWYQHGNVLFKKKEYDKAKAQYIKAIKVDSFNDRAFNNLIYLCLVNKDPKGAVTYLKKALKFKLKINKALVDTVNKYTKTDITLLDADYAIQVKDVKRFMIKLTFEKEVFYENCYIVFDNKSGDAVIIDPGNRDERIQNYIKEKKLKVRAILNTHGHFDHIKGNKYYSDLYKVKIFGPVKDMQLYSIENKQYIPDTFINNEGMMSFGTLKANIFHTPGHTPGSICFLINDHLFSGDTIFKGAIGKVTGKTELDKKVRTDKFIQIIRTALFGLKAKTIIFPGHGYHSTIGYENKNKIFAKNQ